MKERKELSAGPTPEEAIALFPAFDETVHECVKCPETGVWQVFRIRKQHDSTIRKPLHRVTRNDFRHYRRKIIVGLLPGDLFSFRLKGTRKTTFVEIEKIYAAALQWEAFATMSKKRAEKANRKKQKAKK